STPLYYDGRTRAVLQNASLHLGPMTHEALLKAITEPAARYFNVTFEKGLPEQLVADALGPSPKVGSAGHLPLLQFALGQLWQVEDGVCRRISPATYGAIGGLTGAIERYAAKILSSEFSEQGERLTNMLTRLADPDHVDVRRVATRVEIGELDWLEIVLPL